MEEWLKKRVLTQIKFSAALRWRHTFECIVFKFSAQSNLIVPRMCFYASVKSLENHLANLI